MSILSQQNQQIQPRIDMAVNRLKASVGRSAEQMYQSWATSFDMLWSPNGVFTPAEKLAELGTDAAELFELNTSIVEFMVTNLTGKRDDLVASITERVASIPPFTVHEDGTITLD